jgi:hypothetical protein
MAETLDNTLLRLRTTITDNYPGADVAPGSVLNELLLKISATLQNPIINTTDALDQGKSIRSVIDATTDSYSELMDKIASNYNVTRDAGRKSVGKLKIVVADSRNYFLITNFKVVQPVLKLNYFTTSAYNITPTPTAANDLQLFKDVGGYYFILPVVAEAVGEEYQVADQTKFIVDPANSLSGFVDAYAYGNFSSGANKETDKDLVIRMQEGLANKTLLSKNSIAFRLKDLYPNTKDISVIGGNDPELTRAKANLFGISTLGMADVYLRTSQGPETYQFIKTGTRVASTVISGVRTDTWQIDIDQYDAPGFYRIISIRPSGKQLTGTLVVNSSFGFSTDEFIPANQVSTLLESRFTRYQTCTATFEYNDSDAVLTSADFEIVVSLQPNIGDIQDLFLNPAERIACADYLAKAAIPCYVSVALTVHKAVLTDVPVDKIKADIFSYINSVKFGEKVYVSKIIDICHNHGVLYVDLPIVLKGDIYTFDGTVISITGTDFLEIPTNLAYGITPRTTTFFIDYFKSSELRTTMTDSISINVL